MYSRQFGTGRIIQAKLCYQETLSPKKIQPLWCSSNTIVFQTTFLLIKNESLSVSSSDHMARRKGDPFSYSSILKKKMNIIFKPGELGCQWYKVEQGVQWLLRHLGCSLPDDEKLRRGGGGGGDGGSWRGGGGVLEGVGKEGRRPTRGQKLGLGGTKSKQYSLPLVLFNLLLTITS